MPKTIEQLKYALNNKINYCFMDKTTKEYYGFDESIYSRCNKNKPSKYQFEELYFKYKELIDSSEDFYIQLHHIVRFNGQASSELKNILGSNFDWVCIKNDLYSNYSEK